MGNHCRNKCTHTSMHTFVQAQTHATITISIDIDAETSLILWVCLYVLFRKLGLLPRETSVCSSIGINHSVIVLIVNSKWAKSAKNIYIYITEYGISHSIYLNVKREFPFHLLLMVSIIFYLLFCSYEYQIAKTHELHHHTKRWSLQSK